MSVFVFGAAFQEEMLSLMLRDIDFAAKAARFVQASDLATDQHRFLFNLIARKIVDHNALPSFVEVETELRLAALGLGTRKVFRVFAEKIYATPPTDTKYIRDQLTIYARKSHFINTFGKAQVLWNSGRHDQAQKFTTDGMNELQEIDFNEETPLIMGNLEDFRTQQIFESETIRRRIPTGIPGLDDVLQGGLAKGEMGILLAEAKKGKSIGLIHMGAMSLMMRTGSVAHFVLEGSTFQTATRYQSRLSLIPHIRIKRDILTDEERDKLDEIDRKFRKKMAIIAMNTRWDYTIDDIDTKLRQQERVGSKPDLVIVDYGDLLTTRVRMEMRFQQAEVFRGLKMLAMMHNVALWTASQATKPKDDERENVLRARDVAESYEKARITDLLVTLNQTARERLMGIMRFHIDIYRDNEADRTILPIVDFSRMILHSMRYGSLTPDDIPDWGKRKVK